MRCPICNRENPHHIENWGNNKIIVWTIICEDCLEIIKNKKEKEVC